MGLPDLNMTLIPSTTSKSVNSESIDVTQSLFSILKPFATPGNAEVGTFSQGDEAILVQLDDPKYLEKLLQFLRSTDDVTDVTISLDLHCYEIDEQLRVKKLSLRNAGFLWLYINFG